MKASKVVVHSGLQLQQDEVHVSYHVRDRHEHCWNNGGDKEHLIKFTNNVFATCAVGIVIDLLADRLC